MKRSLIRSLCVLMTACILAGCSANTAVTTSTVTETTTETTTEATEATTTTEARGHYEFKPVVMSSIFLDIMGEDMFDAYKNYINAVRNGEDEFAVKSENDYDWMIGQFPGCFQPLYFVYTESNYGGAWKNGKATFQYKISKEELAEKEAEFEKLVVDILNENLRDDYSDFEKALALYIYISTNYTYDYEVLEKLNDEPDYPVSAYRFLTTKHGICSECSTAYSYLLLQAGVDATYAGGNRSSDGEGHGWSYVTINGKNYHIDPTYGMCSPNSLSFFMMTDEQREKEDGYKKSGTTIACHYKGDKNGDKYTADDDTFAPLWGGTFISMDHEKKIINYYDMDGNPATFDYSKFG